MPKEVTLKEISKIVGLSISTISKSLSDSPEISDITKTRVKEIAKDLQYTPNYFGLGLKRKNSKTIGVILPTILNPGYAKLLYGIDRILSEEGYRMITCFTNDSGTRVTGCLAQMTDGSVDGLIVCTPSQITLAERERVLKRMASSELSMVYLNHLKEFSCIAALTKEGIHSAHGVCQNLVEKHLCENIAFVSLTGPTESENIDCHGYKEIMNHLDLRTDGLIIRTARIDTLQEQLGGLLESREVEAILCANKSTTMVVLDLLLNDGKLNELKIHVAGFYDEDIQESCPYPYLSMIDENEITLGKLAAERLLEQMMDKKTNKYRIRSGSAKLLSGVS